MKVDVLLATYCGAEFVVEQMSSILNSNIDDDVELRILVSDDGSSDDTVNKIKLVSQSNSKLKLISQTRKGGVKENFEFLMGQSSGELVFFSDQDDYWLPNKIQLFIENYRVFKAANPNVPVLIFSDLCVVDEKLFPCNHSMMNYQSLNKHPSLMELIVQNTVTGCAMAVNRELIDRCKGVHFNGSIMHDWYLALVAKLFGTLLYIDKPTILYRQHGGNQVGAKKLDFAQLFTAGNFTSKITMAVRSISLTREQSEKLLADFGLEMNLPDKKLIESYIHSFNQSFINRAWLFFSSKIRKKGGIRGPIFFVVYVFWGLWIKILGL